MGWSGSEYQKTDLPDYQAGERVPGGYHPVQHGPAVEPQPVGRMEDAGPGESEEAGAGDRRGPVAV